MARANFEQTHGQLIRLQNGADRQTFTDCQSVQSTKYSGESLCI